MKKTAGMFVGAALISNFALSAPWGGKEIQTATTTAFTAFSTDIGEPAFAAMTGITANVNRSGNAVKILVNYNDNGTAMQKSYFCHEHEPSVIDCH